MNTNKLSIIIPSRNERFLFPTIKDLLKNARGDIEIIVVLDGYWIPPEEIITDDRVIYLHRGESKGMRNGISSAVAIATGDYLMKIDGHCMVSEGYDVELLANIEDNWVVIPRRKRLDAENWCEQDVGKPDVDYNYLSFPDNPADFGGPGLNGRIWTQKALDRTDPKYDIDDDLSFQGSCWVMKKSYFYELELMDEENYGPFWNEAQEIGLKCLSIGGSLKRNKRVFYCHLHKGKKYGRGYFMNNSWMKKGNAYTKKWMTNSAWHKQTIPFHKIIEKFMPIPGWSIGWEKLLNYKDEINAPLPPTAESNNIETPEIVNKQEMVKIANNEKEEPQNRDELASYLFKLGLKKGVEIGVEQGNYSEVLCKAGLELTVIDAWTMFNGYRDHVDQAKLDGFYENTKKKLAPYNCKIVKAFSMDAVKEFADESLDFVYIDSCHEFQNVVNDIAEWSKKVKKGGMIALHNYKYFNKRKGLNSIHVKDVVDAWVKAHNIELKTTKDRNPSCFWFKN